MKFFLISIFILSGCWFANGQTTIAVDIEEEYRLGTEALNNYQYQKALDHFYECHRVEFDNKNYLQKVAFCYQKLGDYTEAKFSYFSLLKKDSANVNAWSNLGAIYEKELNYRKASECYEQLLTIDSTNSFYYRKNAMIAMRLKKPLEALDYFNEAYLLNDRDLVVANQLTRLMIQLKQMDKAELIVDKALRQAPDNLKLLYTKSDILYQKKDYSKIVSTLDHAMSLGDTSEYYQKMIGASYLYLEKFDSCLFHLEKVSERGEASDITFYQIALAYRGLKDFEQSELAYQAAIEEGISKNVGMYFKNLALLLDEQNKRKEAIAAWKKAIEYSPKEFINLFHLAEDCDKYYRDKKIARRYYQKYLDTKHPPYREYVAKKIKYLNEVIHLSGD